jgi:adenosylcobyric acid synthase
VGIANRAGKRFVPDTAHGFAVRRESRIDTLADLIEEHLDTDAVLAILEGSRAVLPRMLLERQPGV